MSKAKIEIKEKSYFKDIHFMYEVLTSFKDVEETKIFIKDIFTKSELRMLKKRWHIANLLLENSDIRTVARKAHAGTQTVIKMKKILEDGHGGLFLALERARRKTELDAKEFYKSKKPKSSSKYVKGWFS